MTRGTHLHSGGQGLAVDRLSGDAKGPSEEADAEVHRTIRGHKDG